MVMKIIFLDADGTLFHHEGYIPESALCACRMAQKNEHKIFLCTGRQRVEIYGDMLELEYDGLITGSGAHIEIGGKVLEERTFSRTQIDFLINYLNAHDINALFETTNGLVGDTKTKHQIDQMIQEQCSHLSKEQFQKHGLVQVRHNLQVTDAIAQCPVNKVSFLESKTPYVQIVEDLKDQFDLVPATFAPFGNQSGEISDKTITKATGIQSVLKYYHCEKKDAIALGDGFNDLCMFEAAGYSVAMGNAAKEVQEKADRITTCLEEDGIWNAFTFLHLI